MYKYITIAIKTPVRLFSRSRYKFFKISFEKSIQKFVDEK